MFVQVASHSHWHNDNQLGYVYLLLVVIAIITVYPLLSVEHTTLDDARYAINFAEDSAFKVAWNSAVYQGRVGHLWAYPLFHIPYLIDHRIWYLVTKYGSLIILLLSLYYMILKIIGSHWVALLSLTLFFSLVQNGWNDHNALTSYPFVTHFLAILFLTSLGTFATSIDQNRIGLSIISSLMYFFSLANELFVLFFPFYLVLLMRGKQLNDKGYCYVIRSRLAYIMPVFLSLVAYLVLYFTWRTSHPSLYEGNILNGKSIIMAIKVIGTYSLSAFPFASLHFFLSPLHQFHLTGRTGLSEVFSDLSAINYIKPVIVSFLFYKLMSMASAKIDPEKKFSKTFVLTSILVAIVGIFIPNLLLGFVQKYQTWVANGSRSYLYTFYSFLSAIIFMALLLAILHIKSQAWQPWIRKTVFSMLALSLAIVSFTVEARNNYIANNQKLLRRKWQLMSAIVNSSAFAQVPSGSVIVAPTLLSPNYVSEFSRYWSLYIKRSTGKNIQVSNDGCRDHIHCYVIIFQQAPHLDSQFALFGKAANGDHRVSYDVFFYSIPSHRARFIIGRYESKENSPSISINNSIITNIGGGSFVAELQSAPVIGQTRIARLTGNVGILLDQTTVTDYEVAPRFSPLSIKLGQGFYGWEHSQNRPSWSWAKEAADLIVFNDSTQNITAKISFTAGSLEPLNLRVFGLKEQVFSLVPGKATPIELTMELSPGENKLKMLSDRPAIRPPNGDTRLLSFSISNITLYPQ